MTIYDADGTVVLEVTPDDTAYRYRAIMGDDSLTLKFSLAEHSELPVGAWCEYQGQVYTLRRPEALTMVHSRDFEYTVTMEGGSYGARIWKFRNTVDGRLKFSLTARPSEHLRMFVDNMNAREEGWEAGDCVDGEETLISYDHAYCLDALAQMADTFGTEYEIDGKTVSLHRLEYNKEDPLPLSYGRGNGLVGGIGRSNTSDSPPVEILFAQGGTDNIDGSKYPKNVHPELESYSQYLLLPPGAEIGYDGERFSDEEGYDSGGGRNYAVDGYGYSVRRSDRELSSQAEDSLDCSSIYPKRVGEVTAVVTESEEDNFYDIVDDTIPDDLDYSECLIEGETMTVIFQSGMLAGREFEAAYFHESTGGKPARRFEIVPQEMDGQTMPGGVYVPQVDDTYAVFNCMLPKAYICDSGTRSGAEWDMLRECVRYLHDHEEQRFTFTGKVDGIWSRDDWVNIGGKVRLGGYVRFTDERFQEEGVLVRIVGIKDYVNRPHSPELELSDDTVSPGFATTMRQIESREVEIGDTYRRSVSYTKRRLRDAQETLTMLQAAVDSLAGEFTGAVSPITVSTMSMLVGDESLQFRFVDAVGSQTPVAHSVTYDTETKQLTAEAGVIQHMTLGITEISNGHDAAEYMYWELPEYLSAVLDDPDQAWYLYARVGRDSGEGEFLLSETALGMESEEGRYHLLVGILNSEYGGERSFASLYGYTEILPGRITTDRIVSGDGKTWFDLVLGEIGGTINFLDGLISGLIGIGYDKSDTKAGLSAEGEGDGSVRIWAGATAEERDSAPFRVTQDGSVYATMGNVGGFTISATDLVSVSGSEVEQTVNEMTLSAGLIRFMHYTDTGMTHTDSEVYLGADVMPPTLGTLHGPLRVSVTRKGDPMGDANVGLFVDVSGVAEKTSETGSVSTGNNALLIPRGRITGVRFGTRRIDTTAELGALDTNVICGGGTVIYIVTLPPDPEDGHVLFVRNAAQGSVMLSVGDSGNVIRTGSNQEAAAVELAQGRMAILIYDSVNACWFANSCEAMG